MAWFNRMLCSLPLLVLLTLAAPEVVCAQAQEAHPAATTAGAPSGEAAGSEPVQHHAESEHPAPAAADAGHETGGHADFGLKGDLPFWSGVAFAMFAFAVWKLDVINGIANKMFTPVAAHEAREKGALANAESLTREANEILRKNRGRVEALDETVRSTIAEASRDAAHATSEILKAARSESSVIAGRAMAEIERVRDQTLNEIFDTVASKVTEATERQLRSQLQSGDQDRLINETLAQIGAGKNERV